MAKTKQTFTVAGVQMTEHEKNVYEMVQNANHPVNYKEVAEACGISPKSACATLARLNKTHGVVKKNEPQTQTTYEVA